ncbi:MAG: hypothetical protein AAGI37_08445 [Planctomycetota bacterium]
MFNLKDTIVPGLLFAIVMPAVGQAEDAEQERFIEAQAEEAIRELFQDFELRLQADNDDADPLERAREQRRRIEQLQRRIIQLELDEQRLFPGLQEQQHAAEPIVLDAKPFENPWAERPREETVAALNHADYAVRESAQAYLLTDDTLDKETLKELIQQSGSPEQSQRLLYIAEHHVMRVMRERDFGQQAKPVEEGELVFGRGAHRPASVGYSYEPVMAHENPQAAMPGVRVIATMPGFPGHAHLRRGDIIVQIAGQSLSPHHQHHDITNWVRWRISAHEAGDTMRFTVLRNSELLAIELVCAEGLALDHMYTTDAFEAAARKAPYKRAWQGIRETLTAEMPKRKMLTPVVLDVE